jgi:hypothetical protein
MNICIYMYIHAYIYLYIHIDTGLYKYVYTYIYIYIYMCIYIHIGKSKDLASVAGLIVQSGTLRSGGQSGTGMVGGVSYLYKVTRLNPSGSGDRIVIADELSPLMLKRFKETVHEVSNGFECGLALEKFSDFQENDEVECLKVNWKQRQLTIVDGASGAILINDGYNKKVDKYGSEGTKKQQIQ